MLGRVNIEWQSHRPRWFRGYPLPWKFFICRARKRDFMLSDASFWTNLLSCNLIFATTWYTYNNTNHDYDARMYGCLPDASPFNISLDLNFLQIWYSKQLGMTATPRPPPPLATPLVIGLMMVVVMLKIRAATWVVMMVLVKVKGQIFWGCIPQEFKNSMCTGCYRLYLKKISVKRLRITLQV